MAGGADAGVLKKLKDLEIENKNLKKGILRNDLKFPDVFTLEFLYYSH